MSSVSADSGASKTLALPVTSNNPSSSAASLHNVPSQQQQQPQHAQDPAALSKILSYAQAVAKNDASVVSVKSDPPERAALFAARDALFAGAKKGPGAGSRKRRRYEESIANRPCSPSLFASVSGSTGPRRNAPLTEKLEHELSSTVTPLYDRAGLTSSLGPLEDETLMAANRYTSLGYLLLPIRRPSVLEKWTPHEIAVFESGLCLHGKRFDVVKGLLPNKSLKDVIEFYYVWKSTSHKPVWKKTFKPVET